jgi:allantoin racemase
MRTRRIVYITPGGADPFTEHYRETLAAAASEGTEISCVHLDLDEEPASPFLPDVPTYYGELFRTIKRLEDQHYDAAIIGCSADPGLLDARRMARMPVTAPLDANLRIADMLGTKVAIFVPGEVGERTLYESLARLYGLAHVVAWVEPVDLGYPPDDELTVLMSTDRKRLVDLILGCHEAFLDDQLPTLAERAIKEHGAQSLYFGCTLWTGMVGGLAESLGVSVLDPGIGALRSAELLADSVSQRVRLAV